MQDPLVVEFVSITGSDESTAARLLRVHNNSLDAAISAFFVEQSEVVDVVVETKGPPPVPSRASQKPAASKDDDWHIMDSAPTSAVVEADRDVATLLAKHRERIAALRDATKSVLSEQHDDIFLLRYVLSFEQAEAVEAVKWAVAWRKEPQNAYWLNRAEEKEKSLMKLNDPSKTDKSSSINISAYHKGLRDGGPLQIVRPGLVDFGPMLDIHDHDRMVMFHVMQKEVAFRMCDRRTRETGRLVKLVVINDFTAMRMSMPPKKVMQSYSDSSKLAERLYPQMLQTTVCINVPTWFSMVMKVGKLFMSAKTLDKFKICPKNGKIEDCPFVRKYLVTAELPSCVGGACTCAHQGGCVPGLPNAASKVRTLSKAEIDKLHADAKKEAAEEKIKIAAFVEKFKLENASPAGQVV